MSLQPFYISGYREQSGLESDKKPFLLPDQAFVKLENAYVWRERVIKRLGNKKLGRLRIILTGEALGNTDGAGNLSVNLIATLSLEATAEIEPGSIEISVGAQIFTEPSTPDGTLTNGASGTGTVNYATTDITINTNPNLAVTPVTIDFNYFPGLPVMGIWQRETVEINNEPTIVWDTKYSYIFTGAVGTGGYQLFDVATTWSGTDSDFFWATNYRGSDPQDLIFFATNFVNNLANAMRYTNGGGWQDFYPKISDNGAGDVFYLTQARILIPYYGRLIALNVWESPELAPGTPDFGNGVNIRNRCRFSQIGSPIATGDPTAGDAWRSDQFGKGGFIDAPTSQAIIGAEFFKNTLIVFFERSTWQLRYVGEYGLPFLWERISSDYGSESTFSAILFDQGVLAIGDKAIITSSGIDVQRIDQKIPDLVFTFRNDEEGTLRVQGIRDFQKQIVYWNYCDSNNESVGQVFPNKVLLFNYENNTFAIFRENITCFGTFQPNNAITWDRLDIFWDDYDVTWDDVDSQSRFPFIITGNQQGYVHLYQYTTEIQTQQSLSITGVDLTLTPIEITVKDHNLLNGELVYISGLLFLDNSGSPIATDLNDTIYQIQAKDIDTLQLFKWNGSNYAGNFSFTPDPSNANYVGGGEIVLLPVMDIMTKDFNPYAQQGNQFKISRIDFQTDATESTSVSVKLYINSSNANQGNLIVGNRQVENTLPSPFYVAASQYAWHAYYATLAGQYLRVQLTYDDNLLNEIETHEQSFELNAMTIYFRPGGKVVF